MQATNPTPSGTATQELPPELARFWLAFATSQIRKGRRDIGAMVQAALEYLFERGTQRLKPMMRSQEDFEAFRNALREEFVRIDKALDGHGADAPNLDMNEPYAPKQFRIVRREDDSKPASESVVVTYWPRTLDRRDELERYRVALEKQLAATVQAIEENTKRLMEARQQLQAQLVPYSPAFYSAAARLLADFDAAHRPVTGLVKAGDEAGLVPTNAPDAKGLLQRLGGDLLHRKAAPSTPSTPAPPTEQQQFAKWLEALNGAAVEGLTVSPPPVSPLQRFFAWLAQLLGAKP